MKIHELVENNVRSDEGLASWLVKTGARLGGKQAVKTGLKAIPRATKASSTALKTAAKEEGFFGVLGSIIGSVVKWFITLGFGYSVGKPIYDYYTNIGKLEELYNANEIKQEEYQYQRQQLMGLMITRIAVVVETAAILGSLAGVLKIFKILLHYVPFAGKTIGWIIGVLTAMDATTAAAAIVAINSKWGSQWITKIAFFHLSDVFPRLKGSQWDLDIAGVLGAGGTWIVDEFKDHVLGGRDPKDKPIQGNTPAEKAAKTDSEKANDAVVKQQDDRQTQDTDQWTDIGGGRQKNARTGVVRIGGSY